MAREPLEVGHDASFAVRWENFRGFRDSGWIKQKRLTLLLGPNGAGKSSFLAPLLLLKQSLQSRTGTNALLTKGDYIDVGVFADFVRGHNSKSTVTFSMCWHSHLPDPSAGPVGRYPPGSLQVAFRAAKSAQSVDLESYRVEDVYGRTMLSRGRRPDGRYSIWMVSADNVPSRRSTKKGARVPGRAAMERAIAEASPIDFLFLSAPVRQAALAAQRPREPVLSTTIEDDRSRLYCTITDHAQWGVKDVLDRLHYIGPLRDPPKRVYALSGEMPDEVGTRGEFAPEIVYRWRGDAKRVRELRRWLSHFGFPEDLEFTSMGSGGFSLAPVGRGSAAPSTFVDTGIGLSQVFPLVVQCLIASPGDWIVVEQPELHLNPRLQAALADLFADAIEREINLVIESHSEHLLMRLRALIANDKLAPEDFGLYFVENRDGESEIRPVEIQEDGFIDASEWPKGFFEDSLRESMALSQAQARRRRRIAARARKAELAQLRLIESD